MSAPTYQDAGGTEKSATGTFTTGAEDLATNSVAVSPAQATLLAAAREGRQTVILINESTTDVRFGAAGVTTSNGALLPGGKGSSVTLDLQGAIYAISTSGTVQVSIVELFS